MSEPSRRGSREPAFLLGPGLFFLLIAFFFPTLQLLAQSFDPLRRAATGNVLMYQALARALSRLSVVDERDGSQIVARHARLLMRAVKDSVPYKEDVASVEAYLLEPDRAEASARGK